MIETIQSDKHDCSWTDLLAVGAVAIFRFPIACAEEGQTAKARPCLVVGLDECNGERRVRLAYGSSVLDRRHNRDRIIRDPGDLELAGLRKPTRFEMTRQVCVSVDDPRFVVSAQHGTAVTGISTSRRSESPVGAADISVAADARASHTPLDAATSGSPTDKDPRNV